MDASSPLNKYTTEDLISLKEFLSPGSAITYLLHKCKFDPDIFCDRLRVLSKEWQFVYCQPLETLPLTMFDPKYEGWRRWRFSIGK